MQNPSLDKKLRGSVSSALLALLACVIWAVPVAAQNAPLAPTVSQVKDLLRANGTEDVGALIGPIVAQQVIGILRSKGQALSVAEESALSKSVITYLRRRAELDHLSDSFVPIYQKYFTRAEVRELTTFYKSPLGRKLISTTPAISLATAQIGQEWAGSVLPGLETAIASQLQAIQTRGKTDPNSPRAH